MGASATEGRVMGTLPGWALDLITDGVNLRGVAPKHIRSTVIAAVRRVMLSAHRADAVRPHPRPAH